MATRKLRRASFLAVSTAAIMAMWATGPAWAADGYVNSVGGANETVYTDNGDTVQVCDNAADGHGAYGWIAVQQANGSYLDKPHHYNGDGVDTCHFYTDAVGRESANIALHSCVIDGAGGTPYKCATKIISGS